MKNQRDIALSNNSGYGTSMPRKKKEKNRINSQIDVEGHTGFMHSLMGEEAIEDNRQHMAKSNLEINASPRILPSPFVGENNTGNYQLSMGNYTDANNQFTYPYQSQANTNQKSNGLDTNGGMNDVDPLDGNNNGGYDYMKAFQMIPMQRFMGSSGQDSYKYDNSTNQHQVDETRSQQVRPHSYGMSRDIMPIITQSESNLSSMNYLTKYGNESHHYNLNQNQIHNLYQDRNLNQQNHNQVDCRNQNNQIGMVVIDKADIESETQSQAGGDIEQEHDPAKRKTRNQREQKRCHRMIAMFIDDDMCS